MKTDICLELAKLLGFLGLGYWGLLTYKSWICAVALGMLGSAIIAVTYKLSQKQTN
jgi:hypothetical protein